MVRRLALLGLFGVLGSAGAANAQNAVNFATSPVPPAYSYHAKGGAWACTNGRDALRMPALAAILNAAKVRQPPAGSELGRLFDAGICRPLDPRVAFAVLQKYREGDMSDDDLVGLAEMNNPNGGQSDFYVAIEAIEPATAMPATWSPDPRYVPPARTYTTPKGVLP